MMAYLAVCCIHPTSKVLGIKVSLLKWIPLLSTLSPMYDYMIVPGHGRVARLQTPFLGDTQALSTPGHHASVGAHFTTLTRVSADHCIGLGQKLPCLEMLYTPMLGSDHGTVLHGGLRNLPLGWICMCHSEAQLGSLSN